MRFDISVLKLELMEASNLHDSMPPSTVVLCEKTFYSCSPEVCTE